MERLLTREIDLIDAVVMGWRPGKAEGTVGALILGLYEPDGRLREVGHSSGFTAKEKRELPARLAPYESGERGSAEPSRWSAGKDLSWEPIRAERVCEVKYDHMQGDRFRHAAVFLRWRADKRPADCRYDQLEVTPPAELAEIFGVRRA